MAVLLDKVKVKMGRLIPVWNTERKAASREGRVYIAVHVEDSAGDKERCLLFTPNQIKVAEERARKNPEDQMEKSWWTNMVD